METLGFLPAVSEDFNLLGFVETTIRSLRVTLNPKP